MKLSIIVPVGRPETASKTVASILGQSSGEGVAEIILVGAGIDALRVQHQDRRIRYVELPERRNPSATRIAGIAQATGDWYLFVDDDIELDVVFLARLSAVIASEDHVGAIGARLPGREKSYFSRVTDLANFWSQQASHSGPREWLYSAVLAVPRRVYEEVGGFAPELAIGEDVDLTRRINQAGHRVLYRADLVGYHNHRRTTLSRVLSYSWHNGGLAVCQFKNNPQIRAWNAMAVIRTLAVSLIDTVRENGRDGIAMYLYLPGIIGFYGVFALSLELHYQRRLFEFLRDHGEADAGGKLTSRNVYVAKYVASTGQGQRRRAIFFLAMAVLRENLPLLLVLGVLVTVLVFGACASV